MKSKYLLSILAIFLLNSCVSVDYKSGTLWEPVEGNGWEKASNKITEGTYYFSNSTSNMCEGVKITAHVWKAHDNVTLAPYFIPVYSFGEKKKHNLSFMLEFPNLELACTAENQKNIEVILNGEKTKAFSIDSREEGNKCYISLDNRPKDEDKVEVKLHQQFLGCELGVLDIIAHSYSCIKTTEFAGSRSCKN